MSYNNINHSNNKLLIFEQNHALRHNLFSSLLKTTLIFNLVSLILFSCSQSSSPKEDTVTFSGTVTLEDTTDFSGVKVSLYKPVELDTALVRINQEYPNIGVQISQETEFDHREHEPLYTTIANADGSWKIENVTKGEYNVVAEKDSFGCKSFQEYIVIYQKEYFIYSVAENVKRQLSQL